MAYSKTYSLVEQSVLDISWLLKKIQPICDLICLYNGPRLIEYLQVEKTSFIGNKNNFSFNCTYSIDSIEINYFERGEKHFQAILTKKSFQFTLEKIYSDITRQSIINLFTEAAESLGIHDAALLKNDVKKIVTASNNSSSNVEIKQITNQSISNEIIILINDKFNLEKRYLNLLNDVCQLVTSEACSKFSEKDLVYSVIQDSHESYKKIIIQKDDFEIEYVDYEFDTGHWQQPRGGSVTFKLIHKNKLLFNSHLTSSSIYIQLEKSVQSFSEKIRSNSLTYFSF